MFPLVLYAFMIDAGSTASCVHNCGPSAAYKHEIFNQVQPGSPPYADHWRAAAESPDAFLEKALRVVPASPHSCTPVAVKVAAGRRLLTREH